MTKKQDDSELVELLSALEHEQWMHWSKALYERMLAFATEEDDDDMMTFVLGQKVKWEPSWKPYAELPDDVKEYDRKWARKVIAVLKGDACEKCGCTEERACPGGCSWVRPGLCSRCARLPKGKRK